MISIEAARKAAEAMIKVTEKQWAIANTLPILPDSVKETKLGSHWVSYKRKTVAEAIEIFKQFVIVPFHHAADTFGHMQPKEVLSSKKYAGVIFKGGPYSFYLDVDHMHGYSANAALIFFAKAEGALLRVSVNFGAGYIDQCPGLNCRINYHGSWDRPTSRQFYSNDAAKDACDHIVQWASGDNGPVRSSGNFDYCFSAPGEEELQGDKHVEALAKLEALAAKVSI